VAGNTFDEIDDSFEERVGAEHLPLEYDGYTSTGYQFDIDDDTCVISNMAFEVEYTLPQMQLHASKIKLGKEYQEYMTQLYRHETIHCAITLEALHQIRQISARTNLECTSRINRIKLIEDTIQGMHDEFDRITNLGLKHQHSHSGKSHLMRDCEISFNPIVEIK
jgi:predicted secreted Zn-dependent protease